MTNFTVNNKGEISEVIVLQTAKKLKTRGMDYLCIKNTKAAPTVGKQEQVAIETEQAEVGMPVEKEIVETPEEKEEIKQIEEEPIGNFAYSSHTKEEEIDPDAIKHIKDLGEAYRGQPKVEEKKVEKVEKVEEPKVTEADFIEALDKESFSPKTKEYKNAIKAKYDEILNQIDNNKKQIEEITTKYGEEKNNGLELQDKKKNSQKIIDGINALDLKFLVDRKDNNSINALTVLETLFNEHRQIILDTIQDIKKNDEKKQEIGQQEQAIRTEGAELNNKKKKFIEEIYKKLVSINEIDEETRENAEKLTEFTGIDDDSFQKTEPEPVSVITPEMPVNNDNRVLVSNVTNPFDGVRKDSVNPEKEITNSEIPSIRKVA